MQGTKTSPNCATKTQSPLAETWQRRPQLITDAIDDSAPTDAEARALRFELDRIARGSQHPDTPGLRRFWACLSLGGCVDLLTRQRRWHRDTGARRGGGR